jgi:hypothetical protein
MLFNFSQHDCHTRSKPPVNLSYHLWSQAAQARRLAPDACAPELFAFLPGMLFTNIQLDDFSATLSHLLERLNIEKPEGREWTSSSTAGLKASCNAQALSYKWIVRLLSQPLPRAR